MRRKAIGLRLTDDADQAVQVGGGEVDHGALEQRPDPLVGLFFVVGCAIGVVVMVAIAVRCEDGRYAPASQAADRLFRAARRVNGVGRRKLRAEFPALS
jgi:hypothetical protein